MTILWVTVVKVICLNVRRNGCLSTISSIPSRSLETRPRRFNCSLCGLIVVETISLRFKLTDPDGLHQAQLLLPELNPDGVSVPRTMFDCKPLNGTTSTFDFAVRTAELIDRVTLQMMDVNGYITWATFPIELDAVVSEENVLDVNSDGVVNTTDLTHIASKLGATSGTIPPTLTQMGVSIPRICSWLPPVCLLCLNRQLRCLLLQTFRNG